MKRTLLITVLALGLWNPAGVAQWQGASRDLPEASIRRLTGGPVLYAASDNRVWRSTDEGVSWKRVLSLRGTQKVNDIFADPLRPEAIHAATSKGLRVSPDGGKEWFTVPLGMGEALCLAPVSPGQMLAGTDRGLFLYQMRERTAERIAGIPPNRVHAVLAGDGGRWLAGTEQGLYLSSDAGKSWERVVSAPREDEAGTLEQFNIEELGAAGSFTQIAAQSGRFYAVTREGLLESDTALDWSPSASFYRQPIHAIAAGPRAVYVATDRGLFRRNGNGEFQLWNEALPSSAVNSLHYDPVSDTLWAGTDKGLHRLPHPEYEITLDVPAPRPDDLMSRFTHEPSILEIQEAAIRYAEVHPDKIRAWRAAVARKALLPTLSVDAGQNRDQNVDLDRGGTGDPDRFIIGPEEKSFDWSVGLSWDLGDLVWNDAQTSIDTRSKLMVELREEILTEVTHLYFQRRRLQIEMGLSPNPELPIQIEKEIKLQELTAQIDALTSGFLSKKINSD